MTIAQLPGCGFQLTELSADSLDPEMKRWTPALLRAPRLVAWVISLTKLGCASELDIRNLIRAHNVGSTGSGCVAARAQGFK